MIEPASITAAIAVLSKGRGILRALRQSDLSDKHQDQIRELEDDYGDLGDRLFAMQAQLLQLQQDNEGLRAKLSKLEGWEAEKQRYALKDVRPNEGGPGVLVYELIPSESRNDPPHWICAACYNRGQKSILFREHRLGRTTYLVCPDQKCRAEVCIVGVDHSQRQRTALT